MNVTYLINNESKKNLYLPIKNDSITESTIRKIFSEKLCEVLNNPKNNKEEIFLNDYTVKDIEIEYIRFLEPNIQAWVLLKENQKLPLSIKDHKNIELFIKVKIETSEEKEIKRQSESISKKIDEISDKAKSKDSNNNEKNDSKLDIAILTSNPLIYEDDKVLRTMNDFNQITDSIYKGIVSPFKIIEVVFLPLTEENLEKVIKLKPKILHLLCKSSYVLPKIIKNENFQSYEYINLLFEENNYFKMKAINKSNLDKIFNKKEIENTLLIISTQFSRDVYKMVENYKFKNIFVQHTTLANSTFIANFNEQFYINIIEQINFTINECFNNALAIFIDLKLNQFCCCFHEHESNCRHIKNFDNELYISKEWNDEIEDKFLPHFSHLQYKDNKNITNISINTLIKKLRFIFDIKKNENYCKCKEKEFHNLRRQKEYEYDINKVFPNNFLEKNNIIKLGSGMDGSCIIQFLDYIPNYKIMKLISGRNLFIYKVILKDFILDKNTHLLNVFCSSHKNFEFNELTDIMIEYFKERFSLLNEKNNTLHKIKSFDILPKMNLDKPNQNDFFYRIKSVHFLSLEDIKYENFEKIILKKNENILSLNKDINKNSKTVYFIINNDDEIKEDILNQMINSKNKIVLFTFNEVKNIKERYNLPNKTKIDYKIYYQEKKVLYENYDKFELFINEKMKKNKEINKQEINIDNDKSNFKYEILYLFEIIKSEIFEEELKIIYPGLKDLLKNYIIRIKNIHNKIKNFSKNNNKNIEEEFKNIYKFEKSGISLNNFDNVKKRIENSLVNIVDILKKEIKNDKNIDICLNENKSYKEEKLVESISQIINNINQFFENSLEKLESIIENEFKIIIISSKEKKYKLYKKEKISDYFKDFYNNIKNRITDDIKVKVLMKLFKYFALLFRGILNYLIKTNEFEREKIYNKNFKPVPSLKSFSAVQNLGIWEKNNINYNKINIAASIFNKLFPNANSNFSNIFTSNNINLCMNNVDESNKKEIRNYIEDLSISYYTCLKIYNISSNISFIDIFKSEKEYYFAFLRFKLMKLMGSERIKHNEKNLDDLDDLLKQFKENRYIEGELEVIFGKFIIYLNLKTNEEEINKLYEEILDKIKDIENNENTNIQNKKKFINLFTAKTKYALIKHKIKKELYQDDYISQDKIDALVLLFREEQNYFYEIKTLLSIAELYLKKYYKFMNKLMKNNFLVYLDIAFNLSVYYKENENISYPYKYIDYFVKTKLKLNIKRDKAKEENFETTFKEIENLLQKYHKNDKNIKFDYKSTFFFRDNFEKIINKS